MNQYEIEYGYIINNYFSNFQILSNLKKLSEYASICDVLINNKPYELYKYSICGILLIPKANNIFENDFDNIYQLLFLENYGIHFSITKKKNNIIEFFNYDLLLQGCLYQDSLVEMSLKYKSMEDSENILYKTFIEEKLPIETFITRCEIHQLKLPKKEKTIIIRKNKDNDVEKHIINPLEEDFSDYIKGKTKFEKINIGENTSFISILQNIIEDNNTNYTSVNIDNENSKQLKKIFDSKYFV